MNIRKRSLVVLSMIFGMFGVLPNRNVYSDDTNKKNILRFTFSDYEPDTKLFQINLVWDDENASETDKQLLSWTYGIIFNTSEIKPVKDKDNDITEPRDCLIDNTALANCPLDVTNSKYSENEGLLEVSYASAGVPSIVGDEPIVLNSIRAKLVGENAEFSKAYLEKFISKSAQGNKILEYEAGQVYLGNKTNCNDGGENFKCDFAYPVKVTFKGGKVQMDDIIVNATQGEALGDKVPTKIESRNGYAFAGWEYDGKPFNGTTEVPGDIEVTAKWNPLFTVDGKGVAIDGVKTWKKLFEEAGITDPENQTKDFYKFDGWKNGDAKLSNLGEVCQSEVPINVTSSWAPITYNVKCGCDDNNKNSSTNACGHIAEQQEIKCGDEPLDLGKIAKPGFSFVGWIQNKIADGVKNTIIEKLVLQGSESDYNISGDDSSGYTITVTPDLQVYNGTLELYLETDGTVEKVAETKDAFEYSKTYAEVLESVKFASGATVDKDAFDSGKPIVRDGYTFNGFAFVNEEGKTVRDESEEILNAVVSCTDFYGKKANPDKSDKKDGHVIRIASCWTETAAHKIARIAEELDKKSSFDANDVQSFKDLVAALAKVDDTFDKSAYEKDELENRFGDRLSAAIQKDSEKLKVEEGLKWSVEVTSEESTDGKVGEVDIKGLLLADKELVKLYNVTLADIVDSKNTDYKTTDGKIKISMPIPEGYEDKVDKLFIIHYNEDTEKIEYIRPTVEDGRLYGELKSFSPVGIAVQKDPSTTEGASTEDSTNAEKVAAGKKALKTGDQTNIGLVLVMFAVSAILLGYALVTLKKNKGNKEND